MHLLARPHAHLLQVERRNRLRLLQPWLEAMVSTGNTETATHNAVGKIYVTLNKDPVTFLTNNNFYDPKVPTRGSRCRSTSRKPPHSEERREGGSESRREGVLSGSVHGAGVVCCCVGSWLVRCWACPMCGGAVRSPGVGGGGGSFVAS